MQSRPPFHFTLKPEHIQLLRKAYVRWEDCETGAPAIDPKRPYGNSYVAGDVWEILYGDLPTGHDDNELSKTQEEEMLALHRETEKALQVILSAGEFVPGEYTCPDYCGKWTRVR